MIPVIRYAWLGRQPAVARLRHPLEDFGAVCERGAFASGSRGIQLSIDLRHWIAVAILRCSIERQPAFGGWMRVVIGAKAHRASFERTGAPIIQELVAEEQRALGRSQPRLLACRTLPYPRVVA